MEVCKIFPNQYMIVICLHVCLFWFDSAVLNLLIFIFSSVIWINQCSLGNLNELSCTDWVDLHVDWGLNFQKKTTKFYNLSIHINESFDSPLANITENYLSRPISIWFFDIYLEVFISVLIFEGIQTNFLDSFLG